MTNGDGSPVALVTGSSRGLGRAIALELAASGHDVAVNYSQNGAAANEVVGEIQAMGRRALAIGADVGHSVQVSEMFEKAQADLGAVSVLVNNAGITRDNLLLRMSPEQFDEVIRINLRSVFVCTKAALRGMVRARHGRIISIASVAGLVGNAGQANYAASKAGMIGFTKSVAKEVGSRGITANVVAPGFITTDLTDVLGDDRKKAALDSITLGRFGEPQEVAAAVTFLASEAAGYITGQVVSVDGGISL